VRSWHKSWFESSIARLKVNLTACQNSPLIWFGGTSQSLLL